MYCVCFGVTIVYQSLKNRTKLSVLQYHAHISSKEGGFKIEHECDAIMETTCRCFGSGPIGCCDSARLRSAALVK